jgi:hypothetical protein
MREKPSTAREFMRRYPHITAHIVSESLGYATPTAAAIIGLDGVNRRVLPLVRYAIEHEEEPLFASWF